MLVHFFQALPVDGDSIRLLLVQPSARPAARIRCTLMTARLSATPVYEAVSYTWGDPAPTRQIFIDGRAFRVRDNLYTCLLRLRLALDPRVLWIDAICIDKSGLTEKGHQVRLMPKIYSKAERGTCLAW